jgi:hypothetical protein
MMEYCPAQNNPDGRHRETTPSSGTPVCTVFLEML